MSIIDEISRPFLELQSLSDEMESDIARGDDGLTVKELKHLNEIAYNLENTLETLQDTCAKAIKKRA